MAIVIGLLLAADHGVFDAIDVNAMFEMMSRSKPNKKGAAR